MDRTLRNILIDATGNTHRSEFSIDKMYSPDSATGRLGLLELRAFEMPPHPHMSSVQQLLLRAFIARFWKTPYKAPATRWGTELHDRFMLPAFIELDFKDVMAEMREAGFAFDDSWFAPHVEFRFPLVGSVSAVGIELTLRNALEPWHVMGRKALRAAPRVMWIPRWSASKCASVASMRAATSSPAMVRRCPCNPRVLSVNMWLVCATRHGTRPAACTPALAYMSR